MKRSNLQGYLFISPWLIGVAAFVLFPMGFSLVMSFAKWTLVGAPEFIGFKNYVDMVHDRNFWHSLQVTGKYTILSVPIVMSASILLALMLNQKIRFRTLFRTVYYLPAVISGVATYIVWQFVFHRDFGLLNNMLSLLGIHGPDWLVSSFWALPALTILALWGVGGNMVIYLAGLQSIPSVYYDAALIDGANSLHQLYHITLPLLTPTIFFNLVMSIISSFQVFAQALILGGKNDALLFYGLYLYRNAFGYFRMGYACALAWVLLLITLVFNLFIFTSSSRWVYYEGGETK